MTTFGFERRDGCSAAFSLAVLFVCLLVPGVRESRGQTPEPVPPVQPVPSVQPNPAGQPSQTPSDRARIENVQFRGNRRVPAATLRARTLARPGDPYDPNALRRDFMALYNTGLFDDITLRVEDGDEGKIVTFEVRERPLIRSIEYVGNTSVTHSDILDRFRDRRVGLTVESRYDATRIKRAEVVLKQLLSERGRQFATV
ncbi:MAG: POTRA domain-containing protein, partial [Terriglobia bacterium]